MTPEERIRNKVAGLKQEQEYRREVDLRNQFDINHGFNQEAFKTRPGEIKMDDQGRAYRTAGDYVYSVDDLERAAGVRNSPSSVSNAIFDQVLRSTGNPTMAADAVNVANYTPGVGTVIGGQEAYDALTEIPDGYREGDYMDMAKNAGMAGMGIMDAVLTMAPFAKGIMKGARNLPKAMRNAGDATSRGIDAMDNFMAPRPPKANQNVLFDQVVKYLDSRGQ
jgi:hypothetical protein